MSVLGELITTQVAQRGWTFRELSRQSGLPPATISGLVNDPNRLPGLDSLVRLSEVFGLPLRQLIEACGFVVDEPLRPDWRQRAALILDVAPDLKNLFDQIVELAPDDRAAVLAYIETLQRLKQQRGL